MSAVRFVEVTKRFPGVTALAGVSFDVEAGTCHAVCGENGAGKSTLGKVLAGIERPDEGAVELGGARVRFDSPRDAIGAGVAIVHQELAFCENLSVAENLCLGALPGRNGFVRRAALHERARAMLAAIAADIDPARAMSTLSVAEQQLVQIAAAVGAGARVFVRLPKRFVPRVLSHARFEHDSTIDSAFARRFSLTDEHGNEYSACAEGKE